MTFDTETFVAVGAALLAFYALWTLFLEKLMKKLAEKIKI